MSEIQLQSMHVLFGWTEPPFSKANHCVSATIAVFSPAKQFYHTFCDCFMGGGGLWLFSEPIPLLVF